MRCQFCGELLLRIPREPSVPGPVIGRREKDGGIIFGGMDEWLWELYHSHPPRPDCVPKSFNESAVVEALNSGRAYVWEDFATAEEITSAHSDLETLFLENKMRKGSRLWVDECAEGGHARNRKALEGQQRGDACGFWDIQGNEGEPSPPPPVLKLFRRLEGAAELLRRERGWPLLCSRLGMGAVYDGRGACYRQHRDNEWQRLLRPRTASTGSRPEKRPEGAWMNFRELTMLAYVNQASSFSDAHDIGRKNGGRLRCYQSTKLGDLEGSTATEKTDVAPLGGTAIIFRSRDLLHEVLPSFARRYCLTLWICTPTP